MAGKKGRSGRRSEKTNEQVNILANLSFKWAIDNFSKLDDEQKLRIALSLAPKYIPQKIEGEMDLNVVLTDRLKRATERVVQSYGTRD